MAERKNSSKGSAKPRRSPAKSLAARENELIVLATDLAEKQLREGTASPSVIGHFLKQATLREQLEKERLIHENLLLQAKASALDSATSSDELAAQALEAFKSYKGSMHETVI